MPFQFFCGPRGVGKTYSALCEELGIDLETRERHPVSGKFAYVRYSESDLEKCSGSVGNPFKRINCDFGMNVTMEYYNKKGFAEIYEEDKIIGYGFALSTFAGLRGIDLSDVNIMVFDECVQERHKAKRKYMGDAFLHMYETINRNRELFGEPPLKVYLMANSITMESDIIMAIEAIPLMQRMLTNGQTRATDKAKGVYVEFAVSKVSSLKQNTALYRLKSGSDFERQAIYNEFVNDKLELVRKVPLNEYVPKVQYADIYIYEHKTNRTLYACKVKGNCKEKYLSTDKDKFKTFYRMRYMMAVNMGVILFDSYNTKMLLDAAVE